MSRVTDENRAAKSFPLHPDARLLASKLDASNTQPKGGKTVPGM
jgi:hypothetical protein